MVASRSRTSFAPDTGSPLPPLLVRNARLDASATTSDIRIDDGRITDIAPHIDGFKGEIVDVEGHTAIPGLWDAHVHADQAALAELRLDVSSALSPEEAVDQIVAKADTAPEDHSPLIAYGFRDALWTGTPTVAMLDNRIRDRPVVAVSHDLHCGWLNTAAVKRFGLVQAPTGLIREAEFLRITEQLAHVPDNELDAAVAGLAARAASRGVVGFVDFEYADNRSAWLRRIAAGFDSLRVQTAVWPEWLDSVIGSGTGTGDPITGGAGLLTQGPLKVVTDGSLNTRTAHCIDPYPESSRAEHSHGLPAITQSDLIALMRRAAGHGLTSAIHAIGDRANTLALDAFEQTGARGTIEHAQLIAPTDFGRFRELGVTASIQPRHAIDDWQAADTHWNGRTDRAFAFGSLRDAGAKLRLGSDAPVAPLDPWITMASAVDRRVDDTTRWHPEQEISLNLALESSSPYGRRLAVGQPADITVTGRSPWQTPDGGLADMHVAGTMVAGRWTWRA